METYQAMNARHTLEKDTLKARQNTERSEWYRVNAERKANEPKRGPGRPRHDEPTTRPRQYEYRDGEKREIM